MYIPPVTKKNKSSISAIHRLLEELKGYNQQILKISKSKNYREIYGIWEEVKNRDDVRDIAHKLMFRSSLDGKGFTVDTGHFIDAMYRRKDLLKRIKNTLEKIGGNYENNDGTDQIGLQGWRSDFAIIL